MDIPTQPTQQATQATQKYIIEKLSQEQIGDDVVCRIICTTGQIKIQDLKADVQEVYNKRGSIKKIWTFGRNKSICDYYFGNITRLSNKHFQIMLGEDGNLILKDISTNGTWLNNNHIEKNVNRILSQGDEITVGKGVLEDMINLIIFINETFKKKLEMLKSQYFKKIKAKSYVPNTKLTGIFNDYSIKDEIVGQGAFATVKKAIERQTGKTYAVKIINKRKAMGNIEGVTRELDVLRRLNHPRIIKLKGFYEDTECYYLLMDFVSGGDLMDFVAAHGTVGEDAGREITKQILSAVRYIHDQGISHRDLKPDNILIEQDDPVLIKITDFGLSRIQDAGIMMKTFCGTLAYIAPEVISSKDYKDKDQGTNIYSSLADMWSIGCLVYVILTGHLPFSGSTQDQLFNQITRGSYHEGPLKDFKISDQARDFIDCLLQVNPQYRLTAKNALEHPWIKMTSIDHVNKSQVSLSQILSVQKPIYHNTLLGNNEDIISSQNKLNDLSDGTNTFTTPYQHSKDNKQLQSSQVKHFSSMETIIPPLKSSPSEMPNTVVNTIKAYTTVNYQAEQEIIKPSNSKIHDGLFITLHSNLESKVDANIFIKQGINPFFIGRSIECHYKIDDSRLSRFHCFIWKKRHPIGDSIHESPAQGLDDIWYCHTGSNASYVNNHKIMPGFKVLLQNDDEIKIIWDKLNNSTISFRVEINDPTGLYNKGLSIKGSTKELIKHTSEESALVSKFIEFMKQRGILQHHVDNYTNLSPNHSLIKKVHSVSLSQGPNKKPKRAKLAQANVDLDNLSL